MSSCNGIILQQAILIDNRGIDLQITCEPRHVISNNVAF